MLTAQQCTLPLAIANFCTPNMLLTITLDIFSEKSFILVIVAKAMGCSRCDS